MSVADDHLKPSRTIAVQVFDKYPQGRQQWPPDCRQRLRDCDVLRSGPAGNVELAVLGCLPAAHRRIYEELYIYGARSFSIWNGSTGELVFDSGSDFEIVTAQRLGADFNATNDENGGDDRSDDKGPEPEALEIARIDGQIYAFVGLERVGGIMVYNISNPGPRVAWAGVGYFEGGWITL